MEYARWGRANRRWRRRRRRSAAFPAFSAVRFSFDISPAWPFVEWPRRERGGNKYKSDLTFRLYHCQPLERDAAERRDKKEKGGNPRSSLFSFLSLFFSNFPSFFFAFAVPSTFLAFLLTFPAERLALNWGRGWRLSRKRFHGKDFSGGPAGPNALFN